MYIINLYSKDKVAHSSLLLIFSGMLNEAKINMKALGFVGITELYDASLCIFWIKMKQIKNIATFCHPQEMIEEKRITHNVPEHSLDDIPKAIW